MGQIKREMIIKKEKILLKNKKIKIEKVHKYLIANIKRLKTVIKRVRVKEEIKQWRKICNKLNLIYKNRIIKLSIV